MHTIEGQKFEMLADQELPHEISNLVVSSCEFIACHFGETAPDPSTRRSLLNLRIVNCKFTKNAGLGPVIARNIEVENTATGGVLFVHGAALSHVRFRGRCGSLVIAGAAAAFAAANVEFYQSVDWALDVSAADFAQLEIYGVPADLVVRDSSTQVIVRREQVASTRNVWGRQDYRCGPWNSVLSTFLDAGYPDQVLVAPKRAKHFDLWREGLDRLVSDGIAER